MLIAVMLAASAVEPVASKISLLCTAHPNGGLTRIVFDISADDKSYTSMLNDKFASKGDAEVTDSIITLTSAGPKITTVYRISRTTGDMQQDGYLTGVAGAVVSFKGTCQRYEGRMF